LVDGFGRVHDYLRISLTERCNLRCVYCMPAEGVKLSAPERLLTDDEIVELVEVFASNGVKRVRLTGGEPTVRKGLVDLVHRIKRVDGIESIAMTTNGLVFARMADDLVRAGLGSVNISLDTLEEKKFEEITRRRGLSLVMDSIAKACAMGLPTKVNCVVMRDFNLNETVEFVERMTKSNDITMRFIEVMPFAGSNWKKSTFVPYTELIDMIKEKHPSFRQRSDIDGANDTTRHYQVEGFVGRVGFITSMSNHFCATCNRLRLTADGSIKVCLFGQKEFSLRDLMRDTSLSPQERRAALVAAITVAVKGKKQAHAGMDYLSKHRDENRPMILIGG
jgi:GTP 3',8-cyclase / cyclic pyranopterin monophosphate synthase